ncbi:hypothetical protein IAE22_33305, partial [Bacillus sp. S34]|nr:hypothetical protein [Bacillus sp. S34]
LATVLAQIGARFPELADDPVMAESLLENVTSMIAEAHERYAAGVESSVVSDSYLDPAHLATGALHAEHAQHPAGAMLAAEVSRSAAHAALRRHNLRPRDLASPRARA